MNKIIRIFVLLFAVTLSLTATSCDKFDSFPLNIPFSFEFNVTGSNGTYDSGTYCFDVESQTYRDYQNKIKKITFLEASYRTKSVSSASLEVTLKVQVINTNTQTILINYTLPNFKPGNYISSPLVLSFDGAQVQALNEYLVSNKCLRAIIDHIGINGTQSVSGSVDLVLEAETEL
jgi:hypothetical protein